MIFDDETTVVEEASETPTPETTEAEASESSDGEVEGEG